jgi:diguanylate cyclase (GGDEF)-like protein/PAS domain S-box-containing protein
VQAKLETYRAIAEFLDDGIFITDEHFRILYVNPAAAKLSGYQAEELLGRDLANTTLRPAPDGNAALPLHDCAARLHNKGGSQVHVKYNCAWLNIGRKKPAFLFSVHDIGDRIAAQNALAESEDRLRLAIEVAGVGLWDYYPQSGELVWDHAHRSLFGVPLDVPLSYQSFVDKVHAQDRGRIDAAIRSALARGSDGKFDAEYRILRVGGGEERWLRSRAKVLRDESGNAVHLLGSTFDFTAAKLAEQRVHEIAQRDPLTDLPNRSLLLELCERLLAMAQRTDQHGALLLIGLDRFKLVNDNHGQQVGDQILRQVAARLQACTRDEDIVGRLGGDQFLVALRYAASSHAPATAAKNILDKLSEAYQVGALQLHVSACIGISLFPQHDAKLPNLIKQAGVAMHSAKRSGPGRHKFYTPGLAQGANAGLPVESRLESALENDELVLHYQPVIDVETRRIAGVEALLRLPTTGQGFLIPNQFLHIAEASGLMPRLGEWVVREACRQHRRWRDAGLPAMNVSINIATQQLRHDGFVTQLANCMAECGMDPSYLQIELKENIVLGDAEDAVVALQKIRALGIQVAIDDFGAGHSGVSLLNWLPLDQLKISHSLIRRIGVDVKSRVATDTILTLGKSLDLTVVAEGIESETAFDYMRSRGCDQAQGFYFCHPLAADAFERWCRIAH